MTLSAWSARPTISHTEPTRLGTVGELNYRLARFVYNVFGIMMVMNSARHAEDPGVIPSRGNASDWRLPTCCAPSHDRTLSWSVHRPQPPPTPPPPSPASHVYDLPNGIRWTWPIDILRRGRACASAAVGMRRMCFPCLSSTCPRAHQFGVIDVFALPPHYAEGLDAV